MGTSLKWVIGVSLLLALVVRLVHMDRPLDHPSWRQAETAYMTLRMAQESPPEVLQSKVPYRGTKDVHLAEFPIQPLVTSLVYKAVGGESLLLARCVTMLFFVGACLYLHRITALFAGARAAWFVVAVYVVLPMGVFYSRAVHVDFCVIFFSHAFLWHGVQFYGTGRWTHYVLAVLAASLAFLMKAPYCFYLGLPLAAYALFHRTDRTVRNVATLGAVFVLPLLLAMWFNHHRMALEAGETESLLYPMKWSKELSFDHFFGTLEQRCDLANWKYLGRTVVHRGVTFVGLVLAFLGFCVSCIRGTWRGRLCVWAVCAGAGLYVLLVFPMVASTHDYYSLPLLAPAALLIGIFLAFLSERRVAGRPVGALMAVALLVALWAGSAMGVQRASYFNLDWQRIETGRVIEEVTEPSDLVISSTQGRSTGWSDPRILYFAHRRGWAIQLSHLTPEALDLYKGAGADWLALLVTPQYEVSPELFPVLAGSPCSMDAIFSPEGAEIGAVVMFDLRPRTTDQGPRT